MANEIQYRSSDNVDIRRKDNGVPFRRFPNLKLFHLYFTVYKYFQTDMFDKRFQSTRLPTGVVRWSRAHTFWRTFWYLAFG